MCFFIFAVLLLKDAGNESRQTDMFRGELHGCAAEEGAALPNENYSGFTFSLVVFPLSHSSESFGD